MFLTASPQANFHCFILNIGEGAYSVNPFIRLVVDDIFYGGSRLLLWLEADENFFIHYSLNTTNLRVDWHALNLISP